MVLFVQTQSCGLIFGYISPWTVPWEISTGPQNSICADSFAGQTPQQLTEHVFYIWHTFLELKFCRLTESQCLHRLRKTQVLEIVRNALPGLDTNVTKNEFLVQSFRMKARHIGNGFFESQSKHGNQVFCDVCLCAGNGFPHKFQNRTFSKELQAQTPRKLRELMFYHVLHI